MADSLFLADEYATAQLGADLAMALRPGDAVLLSGDLGAGKSTLARALIRRLADNSDLEVPSPTYTLCQRYETERLVVSHFDFYRLSDPQEVEELGLAEALEQGAILVEWPEQAANVLPGDALTIRLDGSSEGRIARWSGGAGEDGLATRLRRSLRIRDFLETQWGPGVRRAFLQGDASSRRYETATLEGEVRILMDAPRRPDGPPIRDGKPYSRIAHLAEDVIPFIAIAETLRSAGLAAPAIHARRIADGLLLVEHLGDGRIVDTNGRPIADRYLQSARLLAWMHGRSWPSRIEVLDEASRRHLHVVPPFDPVAISMEASLLADWYAPDALGRPLRPDERHEFDAIWEELAGAVTHSMPTLLLRDYHSPNLIWRDGADFPANPGLIDFQDALIGPQAYDVASLAQDARVDIAPELEAAMIAAYLAERGSPADFDAEVFRRDYAILAAQRATKILGIFVRLNRRDGKPAYLKHLPRMRDYLARSLRHGVLDRYRVWCAAIAGIDAK